jgi:hypothetical protein
MYPRQVVYSVLRFILVLLLSFSAVLTPVARAAEEPGYISPSDVTSARFHRALKVLRLTSRDLARRLQAQGSDREEVKKSLQKNIAQKFARGTLESTAETGRTIILIMVLAGAELVRQEIHRSQLEGTSVDSKRLESLSLKAAEQLLTEGSLYSSIAGASVIGSLAHKPLKILQSILTNAISRKALVAILQSGIHSYITFTGWEAGSELWTEAGLLISDDADYNRSKKLPALLLGASRGDANDRRILSMLIDNVGQILLFDDELRTLWLYNTWRLHVATGHFAVLVSSMVAASTVGTAIFPGAGTVAGMMFGVVGGLASMTVPEPIQANITDGFIKMRRSANGAQASTDRAQIMAWLEQGQTATPDDFREILKMQANYRSNVMTAYMEADYSRRVAIQNLQHELEMARETLAQIGLGSREIASLYSNNENIEKKVRDLISSIPDKIEQRKNELQKLEQSMWNFYIQEAKGLVQMQTTASSTGRQNDAIVALLRTEILRVATIAKAFTIMVSEGVDISNSSDVASMVQVANFSGFREDRILKALQNAAQP